MTVRTYGVLLAAAAIAACGTDAKSEKTGATRAALNGQAVSQRIAFGDDASQLGFRPAFRESQPLGAPAVAVGAGGQVYVLDALHERVIKATKGDVVPVAKVPRDADDLAIGPDGAIAVRRSTKPEVLVFAPNGEAVGKVDVSAVEAVDGINLGTSRRVIVTNAFQETFLVGSPAMPQTKASVLAGKREGAAMIDATTGVTTVRRDDGQLELRVVQAGVDRTTTLGAFSLGAGDAARVVGASKGVACVRIEHVAQTTEGALSVDREAACLDVKTGREVFRTRLPAAGAYLPRRELTYSNNVLAFARAEADGLTVQTWVVEGGAR